MPFDLPAAEEMLGEGFSPWILDLGLSFDAVGPDLTTMRMPFSERICRAGGMVCGQALTALADTAAVFAMWGAAGQVTPCTTVDLSAQMMRPVRDADVLGDARILRLGRTMAFVEVKMHPDGDPRPAASATVTLAIWPDGPA